MAIRQYNYETRRYEDNPYVIDVLDAAQLVGIHPDTIRAAVKRGENIGFPVIKAGRRYVVPKKPLYNLLGIEEN